MWANVFFPASGSRSGSTLSGVGSRGSYWSASPSISDYTDTGHNLNFGDNFCAWDKSRRAIGFPVRAVAEE